MNSLRTTVRVSLGLLLAAVGCFATSSGRVGVASGLDPAGLPIVDIVNGSFNLTPDASGGGIFEIFNPGPVGVSDITLNLTEDLPGDFAGVSEKGTGTSALTVTVDYVSKGKLATLPNVFDSFVFPVITFDGALAGSCGTFATPLTDVCLSVEFTGATIPVGGDFFLDLDSATNEIVNGKIDTKNVFANYPHAPDPYQAGSGPFSGVNGVVTNTPEPASLRFLLGGGFIAAWLLRKRWVRAS